MVRLGLQLAEEGHRGKVPFLPHGIKGTYYQCGIGLDVDLDHLAGVAFVRFHHCKAVPFHAACWEGSPYTEPTLEIQVLEYLHKLFGICKR